MHSSAQKLVPFVWMSLPSLLSSYPVDMNFVWSVWRGGDPNMEVENPPLIKPALSAAKGFQRPKKWFSN
eukprot:scaffold165702_cov29-Attheya_sp.AAC.1